MNHTNTILTIFGSTGDLTIRKLLPAIEKLLQENLLEPTTQIIAVGRRNYTTESYLAFVEKELKVQFNTKALIPHVTYFKLDVDQIEDYLALKAHIEKISNPSQKARAWIRKALMEKVLCDFLKVLYFHSDNAAYDFNLFIYLFIYFSLGDD